MVGPHPPSPKQRFLNLLVFFLWKRPQVLWVLLWLVMMLMAGAALSSLLSPGLRVQEAQVETAASLVTQESPTPGESPIVSADRPPETTPPVRATQLAVPPQDHRMIRTLWLAGGLALMGTLASLMLLKQINPKKPARVTRRSGRRASTSHYPFAKKTLVEKPLLEKPLVEKTTGRSAGIPPQKVSPKAAQTVTPPPRASGIQENRKPVPPRPPVPLRVTPSTQVRQTQAVVSKRRNRSTAGHPPRVTIVPPEQSHALDLRGQTNLAEMVDIRKRRANYR
ncbi:MAG: hypothetical protein SFW36_17560 [Leptolyngbyaceae cyanobacterium bins.59]|nr:hypothetical protein [Leptolyngbyaceae cyanobacterium bins.59]